jgi:hypothetical protein
VVAAATAPRDSRTAEPESAKVGGGALLGCKPATPNERVCVGWPVCEAERPICAPKPGDGAKP